MGVQDPLCDAAPTEISGTGDHVPQGVTKVVVPEPISVRAAEQGSNGTHSHQAGLWQNRDGRLHSTFRVSSLQNVPRGAVLTHTLILLIIVHCHNCLHEHSNSSKHEVW